MCLRLAHNQCGHRQILYVAVDTIAPFSIQTTMNVSWLQPWNSSFHGKLHAFSVTPRYRSTGIQNRLALRCVKGSTQWLTTGQNGHDRGLITRQPWQGGAAVFVRISMQFQSKDLEHFRSLCYTRLELQDQFPFPETKPCPKNRNPKRTAPLNKVAFLPARVRRSDLWGEYLLGSANGTSCAVLSSASQFHTAALLVKAVMQRGATYCRSSSCCVPPPA